MSVYLITGGANGIGTEIAARLHSDGHSILFADIERVALPGVRSVICDLSDEAQIASLMFGVEAVEGELDGLIHNNAANDTVDTAMRLINAAAGLLRTGKGGTAIAVGLPELLARKLNTQLGPRIRVGWLAGPGAADQAEAVAVQAANMLMAGT